MWVGLDLIMFSVRLGFKRRPSTPGFGSLLCMMENHWSPVDVRAISNSTHTTHAIEFSE